MFLKESQGYEWTTMWWRLDRCVTHGCTQPSQSKLGLEIVFQERSVEALLPNGLTIHKKHGWPTRFFENILSAEQKYHLTGKKGIKMCDSIDGHPPGSAVPGIIQARALEWVAISFSNAWKWKVKSLSCVRLFMTPWTAAYQAPPSMGFSRQE